MKTMYENEQIRVEKAYDFLCKVYNKTDKLVLIRYNEPGYNFNYDDLGIAPHDFVGIRETHEGYDWLHAFENGWFEILKDENVTENNEIFDITQFIDDCETIENLALNINAQYKYGNHSHNTNVSNSNKLVTVIEILKSIK